MLKGCLKMHEVRATLSNPTVSMNASDRRTHPALD